MTEANFLRAVFNAINQPCLVLKPEGEQYLIVDANQAYLKITGTTSGELLGRPSCDVFPQDLAHGSYGPDSLAASLRKVVAHKKNEQMEGLRYDIPVRGSESFQEKYWNIENTPVLDDSGQVAYILHTVQEVTAQVLLKKKEQQLQKKTETQRQQVGHFIEANPDGLYSMDRKGNFLNSNQGLADIAGLPLEELLKMSFLPFCSEEDRDHILKHFQKAISGEAIRFEAKFITAKGREVILDLSLVPMKSGGQITGAYGIAKDLTSLRQSEKVVVTKRNYLQANATFIHGLMQNGLNKSSLRESLALIGKAVDVARIYYFQSHPCPDSGQSLLSLELEWTNGKVAPQINKPQFQNISVPQREELIGVPERDRPFMANTIDLPEGRLKQLLQGQDTYSILLLPIFVKDELYGLIGFNDCVKERQWTEEEIRFLKTLAANLTSTFEERAAKAALKEQQEALKLSEQKFRALVQEGSDLTAILDIEGNYKFASDSTTKVLGTPPEEYLGRNAFEFIHPKDQDYITEQYASLESIKQLKLAPYRFMNNKGEWRWLETTLTNLTEDSAVQGIVANSKDITRILTHEQEIRQLNERYRLAAAATQDVMYDWDMENNAVIRYHKGGEFLGHPVSKIDERHFWRKNIHPEELEALKKKQETILLNPEQNHIIAEYRFRRADGTYAHIMDRSFILRNSEGKAIRMVGATRDISDMKAKEEALEIANRRYNLAVKATNEMIWDWDMHTGNIKWGKVFKEIFGDGVSKDSRPADLWYTKIHAEDRARVEQSLAAAIKDPAVKKWREEYRMLKLNGGIAYVNDRAFIVRDTSRKAIRMVGSVLDTTESRMAMKKIREQNRLLREVAWDQSHLVRAPLTRMKMLLDLMELGDIELLPQKDILQHLHASYEELDLIVRNIVNKSEKIKESAAK